MSLPRDITTGGRADRIEASSIRNERHERHPGKPADVGIGEGADEEGRRQERKQHLCKGEPHARSDGGIRRRCCDMENKGNLFVAFLINGFFHADGSSPQLQHSVRRTSHEAALLVSRHATTKGSTHYFAGVRNASVHELAAFASAAAGMGHCFPRTPSLSMADLTGPYGFTAGSQFGWAPEYMSRMGCTSRDGTRLKTPSAVVKSHVPGSLPLT